MKKAIIYLRTSSDRQIDNTSLPTQESICRSYCTNEGFEVINLKKMEAVSAKETNTQRTAELLEFVKDNKRKFEVLVVFKLDRFARSQEQHHWLRGQLSRLGVVLRSATERIDESPSGRLVEGVLAAVNEYDNEVRKERVKIALYRRLEEGLWPWNSPVGYYHPQIPGVRLSVCEEDKNCSYGIIKIFEMFSIGAYTYSFIAKELNLLHLVQKNGKLIKFTKQSVQKIINNIFYIGLLKTSTSKTFQGKHKPLISMYLWNKCQDVIKNRASSHTKTRIKFNSDFPLRAFIRCDECKELLTACWSKSMTGKKYGYYYCKNKSCSNYAKSIGQNKLHEAFYDYLKQVKPTEEFIEKFRKVFINRYKERQNEILSDYKTKVGEIDRLTNSRGWLIERAMNGIIPEKLLKEELDKIEQKISYLKVSLNDSNKEDLNIESVLDHAFCFIQTIELSWFDASFSNKIKLQKLVFPKGIYYGKSGLSNSEISPLFGLIHKVGTEKYENVRPDRIELSSNP